MRNHLSPSSFLSAKDEEADKVLGLTCGGDDYITKPFLPRELVARVKSCLRRSSYAGDAALQRVLRCRGIELDPATHVASLHGERLSLTPKEFDLLAVLLRASGGQLPLKTFMKRFGKICICLQAPIPLWYIFDICDQSSRRSTPSRCLSRPSGALAIRSRPSLGEDVWGALRRGSL